MRSSVGLSITCAVALGAACANASSGAWPGPNAATEAARTGEGRAGAADVGDAGVPTLPTVASRDAAAPPVTALPPCVPGGGTDYQVGPGAGQLASLAMVPWNKLSAGDTVRIFWRPTPYKEKFLLTGHGTAARPIRVCGVKGPQGQRPIIDGRDATTGSSIDYGRELLHQTRNVVIIKGKANVYEDRPEYVAIEGLEITGQLASYSFTDNAGAKRPYDPRNFAACLWIERGHHIVVRDNVIHDCSIGIFSRSVNPDRPNEDFQQTKDLLVSHNWIYDSGIVGDDHEHTTYIQTIGVTYEFNHYGPLRTGATGGALKDRSVGAVIRYNFIEGGARSLDLVEAEDYATVAVANPAYRTTFVYGNVIRALGSGGTPIHYGGDHFYAPPGSTWGEPIFRKGTLYFFNNTVVLTGKGPLGIFDLSTIEEHAEAYNNVFYAPEGQLVLRRSYGEEGSKMYVGGGTLNLGKNWISSGWVPQLPQNPLPGSVLTGTQNLIEGAAAPIDMTTFAPLPSSPIRDVAIASPPAAAAYPVEYQWDPTTGGAPRAVRGSGPDLGAIEGN